MEETPNDTFNAPQLCGYEIPKQVCLAILSHCIFPGVHLVRASCAPMQQLVQSAAPELCYLHVPRDFDSVQLAIDMAPEGSSVMLAAGVHKQQHQLQLRSGVQVVGTGAESTVLTCGQVCCIEEERFAAARTLIEKLQRNCYWVEVPDELYKSSLEEIRAFFDSDGVQLPPVPAAEAEAATSAARELVLIAMMCTETSISGVTVRGRVEMSGGSKVEMRDCSIGSNEGNAVQVTTGAIAVLEDCKIKEFPNKRDGVFVRDVGSHVTMRRCNISCRGNESPFERWGHKEYGLEVWAGAAAVLEECRVRDGIHLEQAGSQVSLRNCSVVGVGTDVSGLFLVPEGQQNLDIESDTDGLDFTCTFDIKSRLLNFIKTKSPTQLMDSSNLQSPSHKKLSPPWFRGKPMPIPGNRFTLGSLSLTREDSLDNLKTLSRNKTHVSLTMTRTESLEALHLLVRDSSLDRQRIIGQMPRTVSLEKLSSIDESASPEHTGKKLSRVQSKNSAIRTHLAELNSPATSPVSASPVPVAVPGIAPARESAMPINAVRRIIGHDLPYAWQLAHELMLDDNFEFAVDGLLLPDPNQRHVIRLFLKASSEQHQSTFLAALTEIAQGDSSMQLEAVVDSTLNQIREVLQSIASSHNVESNPFQAKHICQMLRQQAYGPDQLSRMIHFIVDAAADASGIESPGIVSWAAKADDQIQVAAADGGLLAAASSLLYKLLQELKQLRTDEMNVRLNLFRPAFKRVGAEFERAQVVAAASSGALKLDKTTPWLDRAWNSLKPVPTQLSRSAMVAAHRQAMKTLIHKLALRNKQVVKISALPELLALDAVWRTPSAPFLFSVFTVSLFVSSFLSSHCWSVSQSQAVCCAIYLTLSLSHAFSRCLI